jgi:hypothetical protein
MSLLFSILRAKTMLLQMPCLECSGYILIYWFNVICILMYIYAIFLYWIFHGLFMKVFIVIQTFLNGEVLWPRVLWIEQCGMCFVYLETCVTLVREYWFFFNLWYNTLNIIMMISYIIVNLLEL